MNQNDFYYIAIDENGEAYIEHGILQNVGKKAHKYIMKIGDGAKARYFYTKEEVQAYYNKTRNKASDAANNTVKNVQNILNKTAQTAKKTAGNALLSVREATDTVAETGRKAISNVKSKADRMKDEYKKRNDWRNPKLSDPNEHVITENIITENIIPETIIPETRLIENREIENKPIEIREIENKPIEIKEIEIKKAPVAESARHRPEKTMSKEEVNESVNKAKQERWEKIPNPLDGTGAANHKRLQEDAKKAGLDASAYLEAYEAEQKAAERARQKEKEQKEWDKTHPSSLSGKMWWDYSEYKEAENKLKAERKKLTDKLYLKTASEVQSDAKNGARKADQSINKGDSSQKQYDKKSKTERTSILDLSSSEVEDLRSRIYSVRNTAEGKGRTAIVNAVNNIYDQLGSDDISVEEAYSELQRLENNMKKKAQVKNAQSVETWDNSSNIKTW